MVHFKVVGPKSHRNLGDSQNSRKLVDSHGSGLMGGSKQGNFCAHLEKPSLKSAELHTGRALADGCHYFRASQGIVTSGTLEVWRDFIPHLHVAAQSKTLQFIIIFFFSSLSQPSVFKPMPWGLLPREVTAFKFCHSCVFWWPQCLRMTVYKLFLIANSLL